MRRLFVAGNWKMNKDLQSGLDLITALKEEVGDDKDVDVGVFPPFVYLQAVARALADSPIVVGAQNMHQEESGAYTGEIAGQMILDVGATHVIIGHSERRQYFGESDQTVNAKLKAALDYGLAPIVCVGETLDQREAGDTEAVVSTQVEAGLAGLTDEQAEQLVLAYEPVWAIGTGKTATPEQAQEVHAMIRSILARTFSSAIAEGIRIQYGGSVKPDNASELLGQADIDGALVGGASLTAEQFIPIINAREQ